MKTIKTKLTLLFVISILIISTIGGSIGVFSTAYSTNTAVQKNLAELPYLAAMAAQNSISTYTFTIGEIASDDILTSDKSTVEEKSEFVQNKAASYEMRAGAYADITGYDKVNQRDVSKEPFFQAAMSGTTFMSTPYINSSKNDAYMTVSSPVRKGDKVIGVVYFYCDTYLLQTIISDLQVGQDGFAYILDKEGTVIASPDINAVFNKDNVIKQAQASPKNKKLQAQAKVERLMISGESGIGSYSIGSKKIIQGYAPIPNTDGWSVAIAASESEFMQSAVLSNIIQIIVVLISVGIMIKVSTKFAHSIADPIIQCTKRLQQLAEGDLTSPVPDVISKDELKTLSDSTSHLIQNFHKIVDEFTFVLSSISEGDLTHKNVEGYFPGDFAPLKEHLYTINKKLHETISCISDASMQVSIEASQVSATSESLSQGASQQAQTMELLATHIKEINDTSKHTAKLTEHARSSVKNAGTRLEINKQNITGLNNAMENITTSSNEITKVIETIQSIAARTNMLALNASIEAARAGDTGKGFAVVATEVGSLAMKSTEAAKATKALIEHSLSAVKQGSEAVEKVTLSIDEVMTLASDSVSKMDVVAHAVENQTEAIQQILSNTNEISEIVQTTSAQAEESAETSRELFAQADTLKQLIGGFTLD